MKSVHTEDKGKRLQKVQKSRYMRQEERVEESSGEQFEGQCRETGQKEAIDEEMFNHAFCRPQKCTPSFFNLVESTGLASDLAEFKEHD